MATPILHEIFSVRATVTPDVYVLKCDLTDMNGERYTANYVSIPGDTFGLAPVIRQWLMDNPEFPIEPYVPPTAEELRASMSPLTRLNFRNKFKAAGMTTTVINAYIAAIEDESTQEDRQIYWEDTQSFMRLDVFVVELAVFAGKTPEEIDTIWAA